MISNTMNYNHFVDILRFVYSDKHKFIFNCSLSMVLSTSVLKEYRDMENIKSYNLQVSMNLSIISFISPNCNTKLSLIECMSSLT